MAKKAAAKPMKGKGGKAMAMAAEKPMMLSGAGRLVLTFCMIGAIPFSIPTLMLLFVGLLPTLVAALTDRSNARYAWICVGGLNFAGLTPALLRLWFGHHEVSFALHQVTDFRVLLLSYAAAACGWLLYFGAPPIVITIMLATTKRRAMSLEQQMKKLEEEWGPEVASRPAMATPNNGERNGGPSSM